MCGPLIAFYQETPFYGATVKIHEPVGVIGIACPDECPLLAFVSLLAPAVIRGNTIVIIPSEKYPLVALDMYQVHYDNMLLTFLSLRSQGDPEMFGCRERVTKGGR